MFRLRFLLIGLFIFGLLHPAFGFRKSRIIFYYVKAGEGITAEHKEMFKKAVRNAIRSNPKFELVSDDNIEAVFKRYDISEDGCTTTECAIKVANDPQIAADYAMYGELNLSDEGLFMINVRVVSVEKRSILWEPLNFKRAESVAKFTSVANALINEFSKIIPVEPRIKTVRADNSVIIDVGAKLGVRKGLRYYAIFEMQVDPFTVERDTLAMVEVTQVNDELSLAKVIKKYKDLEEGAKLVRTAGEVDDTPPVIQHQPVLSAGKFLDIPITAEISDNKKLKRATLYYATSASGPFQSVDFAPVQGQKNLFEATIPSSLTTAASRIYYYIEAEDFDGNVRTLKLPGGQPLPITVKSVDTTPPQITYNPAKEKPKSNEVVFTAKVFDDVRVKEVKLFYKTDQFAPYKMVPMLPFAENVYGVGIPLSEIGSPNLWYYIEASDFAGNKGYIANAEEPIFTKISSVDVSPPQVTIIKSLTILNNKGSITARVTDDSGVKSVKLEYSFDGVYQRPVDFVPISEGLFKVEFTIPPKPIKTINYRVVAFDDQDHVGSSHTSSYLLGGTFDPTQIDRSAPNFSHFYQIHFGLRPANYKPGSNLVYPIIFKVDDDRGVDKVECFYRNLGQSDYQVMTVGKISKDDDYGDLLIGSDMGIEFYFKATDVNNNSSFLGSPESPFRIVVNRNPKKMGKLPSVVAKKRKN